MLCILSPAKKLDLDPCDPLIPSSDPQFKTETSQLIKILKKFSQQDIAKLMSLSKNLSELNHGRFQNWNKAPSKPAILLFKGDVYQGLQATTLTTQQLKYAQKTLRILSGLYGLLRPMDDIKAYRLEMGTKLANPQGDTLYAFWEKHLAKALNLELKKSKHPYLINLASQEYFSAVDLNALEYPVLTPLFKDEKNGQFKIISFYAKKARGLMARYIVENKINDPADLKHFDYEGYQFSAKESNDQQLIFKRDKI